MINFLKTPVYASLLVMAFSTFISCSDDENELKNDPMGLQLRADPVFGDVLTDAKGKTLYFFSNDAKGTSTCTGGCLTMWPKYHSAETSTDMEVDKAEIGEITRADGSKQTTYKGWPLYYFTGDNTANTINGDGLEKIWFVAKPDYMLMVVNSQLVGANGKNYKEDLSEGMGNTIYFTDDRGRTLYAFAPDKFNKNTFTKEDFSNDPIWPIYQMISGALPSIIADELIDNIDVFGKKQLTYKGWPLYYFGQDSQIGDNKGVSVPQPGVWPVVNENSSIAPSN